MQLPLGGILNQRLTEQGVTLAKLSDDAGAKVPATQLALARLVVVVLLLVALVAAALGSLLVGFAGESLASSSHGFQSCSNGTRATEVC